MTAHDFAIMFNCKEGGVIEPIEWGPDQLKPDRSIIVLDESSMNLYLWHGKSQGLVARRTALRQADSLKGHGYSIEQSIIGRDIKEVKEIDERKVGRVQDITELNDEFRELLNKKHRKLENNIVTFDMSVREVSSRKSKAKPKAETTPKSTPKPTPKPEPKIEPIMKSEPKPRVSKLEPPIVKPISSSESEPSSQAKMDLKTKAKVAFVLISLLDSFDDIWVSRKDNQQFSVEMMDGPICTFSIIDGRIKFTKNSFSGISPDIKTSVQKKFVDLNNLLK
jgi:hypothetical protein